jgi:hypothetical protein
MANAVKRGKPSSFLSRAARIAAASHMFGSNRVGGIATMMFVALFAFGGQMFGWEDDGGRIQLALVAAYLFGIIGGFKVKN